MGSLLKTSFDLVIWILVPLILVMILRFTSSLSKRIEEPRHKSATQSGFWAGCMLFVMALIYQVSIFLKTGFPNNPIYAGFDIRLALLGGIAGFIVFIGGRKMISPKLSGWIVLVITFLTLSVLFHYLFVRTYNAIFLSLTLGTTFGVFAHLALSPSSLRDFLKSR